MGLSLAICRFLIESRLQGVSFERTLTLGHQHLSVGPRKLVGLLREHGLAPAPQVQGRLFDLPPNQRSEAFLHALGAKTVEAMDLSAYEGAQRIHDLNQPVPPDWKGRYSLVLDSGTLEHVFNFPVAIKNVMELAQVGGHVVAITPANNLCGHGFYQFSPELFFSLFTDAQGYSTPEVTILEMDEVNDRFLGLSYPFRVQGRPYRVQNPQKVQGRVELINDKPAMLFVRSRRTRNVVPLEHPPQQSDYLPLWARNQAPKLARKPGAAARLANWLQKRFGEDACRESLSPLMGLVHPCRWPAYRRKKSLANRQLYQPRN